MQGNAISNTSKPVWVNPEMFAPRRAVSALLKKKPAARQARGRSNDSQVS